MSKALEATENSPAQRILQRVFGYPNFRGDQEKVIEHVLNGGDALVLMPTGGGKSLCFQIPALLRNGVGIVVSPLIALMQDHCCPKQILQLIKMLSKIRHRLIALELGLFYQAAAHKVHLANAVNPCV